MDTSALRLEWLCDLDEKRARAVLGRYTTVKATASYEQVLADPAVAAVAIATPAATHFDLVRAALEAGKHVLVEKPLTSSASDGRKLAGLAERSGLVLMCDHTYCYTPAVRRIRDLIRAGEIGDVQLVDSVQSGDQAMCVLCQRSGFRQAVLLPQCAVMAAHMGCDES
jgi:predicted dehydrogenase